MRTPPPPSRAEVECRFEAVLAGEASRQETSEWAATWVLADDRNIDDAAVHEALNRMVHLDAPDLSDGSMLYPQEQVQEWLREFRKRCDADGGIPDDSTVTLWRPTGPEELELVAGSGWRRWPPRLPDQPIFYPVLNEEYATKIARDWNVKASGVGHVTRFEVRKDFLDRYEVQQVGGRTILEYWIPAEDLDEFNDNIVGEIELVATFRPGE